MDAVDGQLRRPGGDRVRAHRSGFFHLTPPRALSFGLYTVAGTQTWTVVAVDRAGNSAAPSNAVTLTVVVNPDLC